MQRNAILMIGYCCSPKLTLDTDSVSLLSHRGQDSRSLLQNGPNDLFMYARIDEYRDDDNVRSPIHVRYSISHERDALILKAILTACKSALPDATSSRSVSVLPKLHDL